MWGGGSEGQLGLGASETEVPKPTKLDLEEKIVCLSCGYYHTALVTGLLIQDKGYECNLNDYKQEIYLLTM